MNQLILATIMVVFGVDLFAQTPPTPAADQTRPVAIQNAELHLGNGETIQRGTIVFDNGKITAVGANATVPAGAEVIDGAGKRVYPGLIAANTNLGLVDIGAVRATRDYAEVGGINPNVRALIAFNTESNVIPTVRTNGILMAQITPQGGLVPGQSSIVQLDAWNWEDAAVRADDGIHLNWPRIYSRSGWWAEPGGIERNKKYDENVRSIREYFSEAAAYHASERNDEANLKFEAMRGLFDGSKRLYLAADDAQAIVDGVNFAKSMGITPVLTGGSDSWLVADFLKDNGVGVIFQATQSLPRGDDADIDQPFKTPRQLHEAGVKFALSMDGYWQQRNLAFQAGQAVGFGLPYDIAVHALTGAAAELLGIGDRTGTLEVGKDATLLIVPGDLLDMRTNKIERAFIMGRDVDLDTVQKQLYQKYGKKLEVSTEY